MMPTKDEFNQTIEEIGKASQYRILRLKNYFAELISQIKESISSWLVQRSTDIGWNISSTVSDILSNIFMLIAFISISAVIIYLIIIIIKRFEKEKELAEILGKKIDGNTTPQSLREKAIQLQQDNKLREAIRYEFIALLYLMHLQSILYLEKTKTNQEIYQYLKQNQFSKLNSLQELIDIFNATWYGYQPCDDKLYSRWTRNFNLLWNGVLNDEAKNR